MSAILIFGLGYSARQIAARLRMRGWIVMSTRRTADADSMAFADTAGVRAAIASATHILSSVPPADGGDPVLDHYGRHFRMDGQWIGALSSTGVYGDSGGAWVDESAPTGTGRRSARATADARWLAAGARVFRLPGIYGPGRSALERVREGRARRIDLPGQVFSRIHVEDIANAVIAGLAGPPGAYNIADDLPCGQNRVIEEACRLLGLPPPPLLPLDAAGLPPPARAFYSENRRVANGKAKRLLGWRPRFVDYRAGLADCLACNATSSPAIASSPPTAASTDQR